MLAAQLLKRRLIGVAAAALIDNFAVGMHAAGGERAQDVIGGAGDTARRINVLDAQQPCAAVMARIGVTRHRGD